MSLERSTRARLTTAFVLFLVLGAGMVLGVALDRRLESGSVASEETGRPDGRPSPDGRPRGFDPRSRDPSRESSQNRGSSPRGSSLLVEQVGLSEVQREKVDSIVGYYRTQMSTLHQEFDQAYSTRFRELNRLVREEVRAVLTDDQRTVYDSLQADWARRRQERREDSISGEGNERPGTAGQRNIP